MLSSRRTLRSIAVPLCIVAVIFVGYLKKVVLPFVGTPQTKVVPSPDPPVFADLQAPRKHALPEDVKEHSSHNYRTDGLVVVNPDGAHPIFELMSRAEDSWKTKLKKASKSLDDAVAEYRRRYHRAPPRGFDDW